MFQKKKPVSSPLAALRVVLDSPPHSTTLTGQGVVPVNDDDVDAEDGDAAPTQEKTAATADGDFHNDDRNHTAARSPQSSSSSPAHTFNNAVRWSEEPPTPMTGASAGTYPFSNSRRRRARTSSLRTGLNVPPTARSGNSSDDEGDGEDVQLPGVARRGSRHQYGLGVTVLTTPDSDHQGRFNLDDKKGRSRRDSPERDLALGSPPWSGTRQASEHPFPFTDEPESLLRTATANAAAAASGSPSTSAPHRLSWQFPPRSASSSIPYHQRRYTSASVGDGKEVRHHRYDGNLDSPGGDDSTAIPRRRKRSHTVSALSLSRPAQFSTRTSRENSLTRRERRQTRREISNDSTASSAADADADADGDADAKRDRDGLGGATTVRQSSPNVHRRVSPSRSPKIESSRRRSQLSRSASEVIPSSAPSPTPSQERDHPGERGQVRHAGHTSGLDSLASPNPSPTPKERARSHADLVSLQKSKSSPPLSRTSSSSGVPVPASNSPQRFDLLPHAPQGNPNLRRKSSGLQLRPRISTTPRLAHTQASQQSPTSPTNLVDTSVEPNEGSLQGSRPQPRKRAKSVLSLSHTPSFNAAGDPSTGESSKDGLNPLSHIGRSFSSSNPNTLRKRTEGSSGRRPTLLTAGLQSPDRPIGRSPTSPRSLNDAIPSSQSFQRPVSISALLAQQRPQGTPKDDNTSPSANDGPSLADILSQVDVKGALALVKEVQATANRPGIAGLSSSQTAPNLSASATQATFNSLTGVSSRPTAPTSLNRTGARSAASSLTSSQMQSVANTSTPFLSEPAQSASNVSTVRDNSQRASTIASLFKSDVSPNSSARRKRKLSIAGLKASALTSTKGRKPDASTSRKADLAAPDSDLIEAEDPDRILQPITPSVWTFASLAKQELETRYLPIYAALAQNQLPPNPAEVARWRYRRNEITKRNRMLGMNSLAGSGSIWMDEDQHPSLYDKIRAKGGRHPMWEVYPQDFVAFQECGGAILQAHTQSSPHGRTALLEQLLRDQNDRQLGFTSVRPQRSVDEHEHVGDARISNGRPIYHRHRSSDRSISSVNSLPRDSTAYGLCSKSRERDRYAINETLTGEIRRRHISSLPRTTSPGAIDANHTRRLTAGGAFSPSTSALGRSLPRESAYQERSSLPASPHMSRDPAPSPTTVHRNHPSASLASHQKYRNAIHASPDQYEPPDVTAHHLSNNRQDLSRSYPAALDGVHHKRSVTDKLKALARGDSDLPNNSDTFLYQSLPLSGSKGTLASPQSRFYALAESALASSAPPSDTDNNGPALVGPSHNGRPSLSRQSSKNSSIANFSKFLSGGRKAGRGGNDTDGYKSTTDNEEVSDSGGFQSFPNRRFRSPRWRSTMPPAVTNSNALALNGPYYGPDGFDRSQGGIREEEETGSSGLETGVFDQTELVWRPETLDVDDREIARACR